MTYEEYAALLAIDSLGPNAYGMTIRQATEERLGSFLSIGALYITLEQLEKRGLVSSSRGGATKERGGLAKRFFALTPSGKDAIKK